MTLAMIRTYTLLLCAALLASPVGPIQARAGQTADWQTTDGPWGGTIVSLAIHSVSGDLYVAARQELYRSPDGGVTWELIGGAAGISNLNDVALGAGGVILVGVTHRGAYWSTNGGITWDSDQITHNPHTGLGATLLSVLVTPSGAFLGGGFRSPNQGASWFSISIGGRDFALDNAGRVVAAAPGGVHRSTNDGVSWTSISNGLAGANVQRVAVAPTGTLLAGTNLQGVFRSTDDGASWNPASSGLSGVTVRALAFAPSGRAYAATEAGLFASDDDAVSWTPVLSPLPAPTANDIVVSDAPETVFAGSTTLGVFASDDGGASWDARHEGFPAPYLRDVVVSAAGTYFTSSTEAGVHRSTDGGWTWEPASTGLPLVWRVVASGTGAVYAATSQGPFVSLDEGTTWSLAGTELAGRSIDSIAATSSAVFALAMDSVPEIYRSTDQGSTWELVFDETVPSFQVSLNVLEAGPDDAVYAGGLHFAGSGVVFASNDLGASWDEHLVSDFSTVTNLEPVGPDELYRVAQNGDILHSTDAAATWTALPDGPWAGGAADLAAAENGTLFASAYGSGVFAFLEGAWTAYNEGLPTGDSSPAYQITAVGTTLFVDIATVGLHRSPQPGETASVGADAFTSFDLRNAPNPFSRSTELTFALPRAGHVRVHVADVSGRRVRSLADRSFTAGAHTIPWDGRGDDGVELASGVYFVEMTVDEARSRAAVRMVR